MRRSKLSGMLSLVIALVLLAPVALAEPDSVADTPSEPGLVSLVVDWWTAVWDAVSPMIDPVGPPASDEVSPMIDPVGAPESDGSGEVSPMIDPVG